MELVQSALSLNCYNAMHFPCRPVNYTLASECFLLVPPHPSKREIYDPHININHNIDTITPSNFVHGQAISSISLGTTNEPQMDVVKVTRYTFISRGPYHIFRTGEVRHLRAG